MTWRSLTRCLMVVVAVAVLHPRAPALAQSPARPFPQHVTYGPGILMPGNYSRAALDNHVRGAYDSWKTRYLRPAGSDVHGRPFYRVALGKPGTPNAATTVSEGQGYGMVIVALMAGHDPQAKVTFDGLFRYARNFPSGGNSRLMSWRITNGVPTGGSASAFDGDADIALGLVIASRQWPTSAGIDYAAWANRIIAAVGFSTIGKSSRLPLLGDWVDPDGTAYNQFTHRSSDLMPASFRAFGAISGNPLWGRAANLSRATANRLQLDHSPVAKLLPDFMEPTSPSDTTRRPADPGFLEGSNDGRYGYNACRVPLRFGMDALFSANATSIAIARRMTTWFSGVAGGNPLNVKAGYGLDGTPNAGSDYFSTAFVAPLGVAAMLHPNRQAWLDGIYEAVRATHQDYYEDTLTLLSMLVMTGNFWDPATP